MSMGFAQIDVMPELLDRLDAQKYASGILIRSTAHDSANGITPEQLVEQMETRSRTCRTFRCVPAISRLRNGIAAISGNSATLVAMLGVFVAISLIVAGYVIANTFQVLVAQRTKELALLRCIGADKRQVYGLILGEAGLMASVAALVGCLLGVITTLIFAQFMSMMSALTISPLALIAGFVVGVVVTVACALGASKRATRVHPVEALRPAGGSGFGQAATGAHDRGFRSGPAGRGGLDLWCDERYGCGYCWRVYLRHGRATGRHDVATKAGVAGGSGTVTSVAAGGAGRR